MASAGAAAGAHTAAARADASGASRALVQRGAPARMLVYAQEWSLWPSRTSLPRGRVIVQLWNRGQDAHDLRVRRVDRSRRMVGRVQGVRVALSGGISEASWTLRPGLYELYCSMPGHRALGMHVLLRVG